MNRRLAALLAEVFGMRESEVHSALEQEDVGSWDSLKQMDLVTSLEREYGIRLEIPDSLQMLSVGAIEEILKAKGVNLGD
jgi:acyl carrier protein